MSKLLRHLGYGSMAASGSVLMGHCVLVWTRATRWLVALKRSSVGAKITCAEKFDDHAAPRRYRRRYHRDLDDHISQPPRGMEPQLTCAGRSATKLALQLTTDSLQPVSYHRRPASTNQRNPRTTSKEIEAGASGANMRVQFGVPTCL